MSGEELAAARRRLDGEDLAQRCEGVELLALAAGPEATEALVALLDEPSWYLRERVVAALAARGAAFAVRRVLREGPWYARASACDVIARCADADAVEELLEQVADRNVSLQKSAVRALVRVAETHGGDAVARHIAALPAAARRRVVARVGHQEPVWAAELEQALASLPAAEFAPGEAEPAAGAFPEAAGPETRALVRFRRWLEGRGAGKVRA